MSQIEEKGAANDQGDFSSKGEAYKKQSWVNPDVVRDIIIGLSDGLTVPFALTAGLSGLNDSKIVVICGMAELVSGAISMGVGGMLSAQAELDHYRYTQQNTSNRVAKVPVSVLNREVGSIFEPLGVTSAVSLQITDELYRVEEEERRQHALRMEYLPSPSHALWQRITSNKKRFTPTRGLTPLLVQMGEGLEGIEPHRVWQSALAIGLSYFIGGFIPLLPYIFIKTVYKALYVSVGITGAILIIFGIIKQKCTGRGDIKSLIKSALSILLVGAAAAGTSWLIVAALQSRLSHHDTPP